MYDQHLHSIRSADGNDSIDDIVASAKAIGLSGICLTDHWEAQPILPEWRAEFPDTSDYGGYLKFGVELGTPHADIPAAGELIATHNFDFVIASIHNLVDVVDFYFLGNVPEDEAKAMEREYILSHTTMLEEFGDFDIIGHIGYPHRYGNFFLNGIMDYREELREFFKKLIAAGKGIELNSSGLYRPVPGGFLPEPELVKLYHKCGGEIITLGSDSHRAVDVGKGLDEAAELLREIGFKYYSVFADRTPKFVKL